MLFHASIGAKDPANVATVACGKVCNGRDAARETSCDQPRRERFAQRLPAMPGISTLLATMRLSAGLLFAAVLPSSPAHAGFMFDLTVAPLPNGIAPWTGSGSIDVTSLSGTSTAGVAAFSFHAATGNGSPQDYTLADIASINWSINSSDALTLLLISNEIPFETADSAIKLSNEGSNGPLPCLDLSSIGTTVSVTCETIGVGNFSQGGLTAAFVPSALPEPGSLALLATTLLGIAAFLRGRKFA
jgi:hypothetical protein